MEDSKTTPWWHGGLYFSCLGCGRCCRGEPGVVCFDRDEQNAMASHLGLGEQEFLRLYTWKRYGVLSLRERPNFDCIFLQRAPDRCGIYAVRPAQCRTFPFWPEVLKSKLSWDKFSLSCPGMNQGQFHSHADIAACLP